MTQDDIVRMAREAGFALNIPPDDTHLFKIHGMWIQIMGRFAQLVAEAEREACAKRASVALLGTLKETSDRVLRSIRARGQQ